MRAKKKTTLHDALLYAKRQAQSSQRIAANSLMMLHSPRIQEAMVLLQHVHKSSSIATAGGLVLLSFDFSTKNFQSSSALGRLTEYVWGQLENLGKVAIRTDDLPDSRTREITMTVEFPTAYPGELSSLVVCLRARLAENSTCQIVVDGYEERSEWKMVQERRPITRIVCG